MKRSDFLKNLGIGAAVASVSVGTCLIASKIAATIPSNKLEELKALCKDKPYHWYNDLTYDPKNHKIDRPWAPKENEGFWDKLELTDKGLSFCDIPGSLSDLYNKKPDLFEHVYQRIMYFRHHIK